jgi:hypothetical protein
MFIAVEQSFQKENVTTLENWIRLSNASRFLCEAQTGLIWTGGNTPIKAVLRLMVG